MGVFFSQNMHFFLRQKNALQSALFLDQLAKEIPIVLALVWGRRSERNLGQFLNTKLHEILIIFFIVRENVKKCCRGGNELFSINYPVIV